MNAEKKSVRWYETAYIVVLLGVLALSITYLRPHRVGVIDMDQAFKELGVAERLVQELNARDNAARARFAEIQKQAVAEEKKLLAAFKDSANDDEKARIQQDLTALQARFQKSRNAIAGDIQRFQRDVVVTFRERIRPHVQKAAGKKRVDIVIEPGQVYQIMNNAVNLSAETIDAARGDFPPEQPLIDEALLKSRNLWIEDEKPAGEPPAAP